MSMKRDQLHPLFPAGGGVGDLQRPARWRRRAPRRRGSVPIFTGKVAAPEVWDTETVVHFSGHGGGRGSEVPTPAGARDVVASAPPHTEPPGLYFQDATYAPRSEDEVAAARGVIDRVA
jgi:hypothetical protein